MWFVLSLTWLIITSASLQQSGCSRGDRGRLKHSESSPGNTGRQGEGLGMGNSTKCETGQIADCRFGCLF